MFLLNMRPDQILLRRKRRFVVAVTLRLGIVFRFIHLKCTLIGEDNPRIVESAVKSIRLQQIDPHRRIIGIAQRQVVERGKDIFM